MYKGRMRSTKSFYWSATLLLGWGGLGAALGGSAEEPRPWREYRTILWVGDNAYKDPKRLPLFFQRLREMGINTGMVSGDADPVRMQEANLPYYVENMVNRGLCLKWNSKVANWDKFVTEWAKSGRGEAGLVRDYCLVDPEWRAWARREVEQIARNNKKFEPWAYDLRDELSTTISANPFDYDFSACSLARFREWLRARYGQLSAVNEEWGTSFQSWDEVKPFTTDQVKNRMASGDALPSGQPDWQALQALKFELATARDTPMRWNFSPWADFRTYMDESLTETLSELRSAARAIDGRTPVGIEGSQMPHAFGGYDLWRLSQAVDWMEPYDIGNAREILGSFMAGKPMLCTLFEADTNHARRRLWHLLLEGDRGCIVWWSEDCIDWNSAQYELTPKGRAIAPVLKEMTSKLALVFLRAQPEYDPIYIHYSQPSIQIDWLMESTGDGPSWLRRFSSYEAEHNRMAKARNGWLKAFQDAGYSPRFISAEQMESGGLSKPGPAVLVLSHSWAFSQREGEAVDKFYETAGRESRVVFWDKPVGVFDEHGKLRKAGASKRLTMTANDSRISVLAANGQKDVAGQSDMETYATQRMKGSSDSVNWVARHMGLSKPEVVVPAEACVRVYRFRMGRTRLLAFERNINYHMSEDLKQAGGNELLEKKIEIEAKLKSPAHVYDLRTEKYVGRSDQLRFQLDPWEPALFAVCDEKPADDKIIESLLNREGR
jgi:hypothetical protein